VSPPRRFVLRALVLLLATAGCGGGGAGGTGTAGNGAGTGGANASGGGNGGSTGGSSGAGGDGAGGASGAGGPGTGASGGAGTGGPGGGSGAGGSGGVSGSGGGAGASGGSAGAVGTGGVITTGGTGGNAGRGGASGAGGRGGSSTGGGGAGGRGGSSGGGGTSVSSLEALQRSYVDLRFGMFIHFGILTYTGTWAQANLPIDMFNPTGLDPGQWADAAVSAHMTYGALTTRHHDGFALWPSSVGNFNVHNVSWMNGQGDVVRAYVDAFRAKGVAPGLYYSVWDNTEGIGNGTITTAQMNYVTTQITELLTNYGPIPILILDGYSWKMGHQAVAYEQIRALVKSLQPNCLLTDHTHLNDPWEVDITNFEEPAGSFVPANNTYAGNQEQKINGSGGNDWFWAPNIGGLMTVSAIVDQHLRVLEPRWTNFLLNCPPNRQGLLDAAIVTRLGEVGAAWSKDASRPPLPAQGPQIEFPYTPASATATSGTAANAIDGVNDNNRNTVWRSSGALPQSITIDLGASKSDVGMLAYVPEYSGNVALTAGAITSYGILTSTNGTTFTEATSGTWAADGKMKVATFGPVAARYVRLEARAVNGSTSAAATELTIGARR
jgi:alpha-L-fucosidase